MERYEKELVDDKKVFRKEYLEWKAAHDNYLARKAGFNSSDEHAEFLKDKKASKKTMEAMLANMGNGFRQKSKKDGKQGSKKQSGAAVKHLRQKV